MTSPTTLTSQTSQDPFFESSGSPTLPKKNSMSGKRSVVSKSNPSSTKTPLSSSITKFYNRACKIHTCCGIMEFNCLKLTSMLALAVSLTAFTFLIVIIALNYSVVTDISSRIGVLQTDATYYREMMKMASRIAADSEYNRTIALEYVDIYQNCFDNYYKSINSLYIVVPSEVIPYIRMNISREETMSRRAVKSELAALELVKTFNYSGAKFILDSDNYNYLLTGYSSEVQPVLDYAQAVSDGYANADLAVTTTSLVVIAVSMAIVIPIMIVFVCLSVTKDTSKEKQLRQVRKYLLIDTINDSVLCEKFKEFCKLERSEENFAVLEKINDYKKLCQRSFDIQVVLYDNDELSGSDMVSDTTTSSNETTDSKKKKNKKGFTEKDLFEIEKKKFELAFEVFTDYLDVRGDHSININKNLADKVKQFLDFFAKGENESLPESLFDAIETDVSILMMDTHHRFKAMIEIQIKEKKKVCPSPSFLYQNPSVLDIPTRELFIFCMWMRLLGVKAIKIFVYIE
ncbi:predicted protein [Naegleria gruberi]|uniref:Predicted protein n=1 Tax=Naegleria gruberi TaxID=5762 RepID=D2VJU8_NAEGR|nr:uncharacterized protein NAEGRDRAFT_50142 [Naegleria gruberi]EFC42751.1 predicted protein [Naegleria gruberi]|eukprot:XP_002675495.1 predicted protein [Naegleria gruberi strain NEG-M]